MRGIAVIVAAIVVLVPAIPADAHICSSPVTVDAGVASTITIGVAAEANAEANVAIQIPAGIRIDAVPPEDGWTSTRDGSTIRFTGGPIEPYGCAYFSLSGVALNPRGGTYELPITVIDSTGKVIEYDNNNPVDTYAAQFVYVNGHVPAATTPSSILFSAQRSSGHGGTLVQVIAVAGAVLGLVLIERAVRARRRGPRRAPRRRS